MTRLIRWLSADSVAGHVEVESREKSRQSGLIRRRSRNLVSDAGDAPGQAGKVYRMKVSYSEGLASHAGPESWRFSRKGFLQALTGERVGRVLSREMLFFRGADTVPAVEGNIPGDAIASPLETPRGQRLLARTEAPCAEPVSLFCGHIENCFLNSEAWQLPKRWFRLFNRRHLGTRDCHVAPLLAMTRKMVCQP